MRYGFVCVGLLVPARNRAWIAVWRLESRQASINLPLAFAHQRDVRVQQSFFSSPLHAVRWNGASLRVTLSNPLSAAVFKVEWD